MEYRRGVDGLTWQKFWHFNEQCLDYPTRSFATAEHPPVDAHICPDCKSPKRALKAESTGFQ